METSETRVNHCPTISTCILAHAPQSKAFLAARFFTALSILMTQAPQTQSLIEYPCHFPIKVTGTKTPEFVDSITALVQTFDSSFESESVELRPSAKGNYIGVTITPYIQNREQLDTLYQALTKLPAVKFVL